MENTLKRRYSEGKDEESDHSNQNVKCTKKNDKRIIQTTLAKDPETKMLTIAKSERPSLIELFTDEILLLILLFIGDPKQILLVGTLCKRLFYLSRDDMLWRLLLETLGKQFGFEAVPDYDVADYHLGAEFCSYIRDDVHAILNSASDRFHQRKRIAICFEAATALQSLVFCIPIHVTLYVANRNAPHYNFIKITDYYHFRFTQLKIYWNPHKKNFNYKILFKYASNFDQLDTAPTVELSKKYPISEWVKSLGWGSAIYQKILRTINKERLLTDPLKDISELKFKHYIHLTWNNIFGNYDHNTGSKKYTEHPDTALALAPDFSVGLLNSILCKGNVCRNYLQSSRPFYCPSSGYDLLFYSLIQRCFQHIKNRTTFENSKKTFKKKTYKSKHRCLNSMDNNLQKITPYFTKKL